MIDISGDVIYFNGKAVGLITVPNGSLRGDFEEALGVFEDALGVHEEIESIMEDYAPCGNLESFFRDVADGKINMSVEIDNMCKKLSAIYELTSWR